jgi:hypothetical protein
MLSSYPLCRWHLRCLPGLTSSIYPKPEGYEYEQPKSSTDAHSALARVESLPELGVDSVVLGVGVGSSPTVLALLVGSSSCL